MKCITTSSLLLAFALSLGGVNALAQDALSPALQAKADAYKAKLVEWAAHPVIVAAAREASAKGALPGMNNGKWNDLDEKDPVVTAFETSAAGKQIAKWEADKNINKLVLRDDKGNVAASSLKSVVYNNAARPSFVQAMKGQAWADKQIKPDPSTGIKSVQASAPVLDGGKIVGVLHTAVTVE